MTWQNSSPLVLYPKLIPHVFKLCIKYRASLAMITASNPGFEYGGLPFASKKQMFDLFDGILPYILVKKNDESTYRLNQASQFVEQYTLPVILKPDTSHRGIDVHLIKSLKSLEEVINQAKWDYLIQKYCPYPLEFGVFYHRLPHQPKGSIISLTQKIIPVLIGDGIKNLEELIKTHPNVDNPQVLLERYSNQLLQVLEPGETFKTLDFASHSRGSQFVNAMNELTPELIEATDKICNVDGFYFGRLDVLTPDIHSLKQGIFEIVEVNGATSEFSHIYDKRLTLGEGVDELKRQWDLLFEVSNENRHVPGSTMSMVTFLIKYIQFFLKTHQVIGKPW